MEHTDNPGSASPPCAPACCNPLLLAAALLAAAVLALPVDLPLAKWCLGEACPGELRELLEKSETFGHGLGVLLVAVLIWQLDPLRRWAIPRIASASLGSGLLADVVKLLVLRTRPRDFQFDQGVLSTFGGWLPLGAGGSGGQSFPSAHTATAVGLAIALAWLYPRGRWLFFALALLAAAQRVESGAHFLSDTFCGAALGCLLAAACVRGGPLARWFDRLEQRWKVPQQGSSASPCPHDPKPD